MKLLIISLHADPTSPAGIGEGGGTHSYIRELLTFFSTKKLEILLVTRKSNPCLPDYEKISDTCKIHRIIVKHEYPLDKKELYDLHDISVQETERIIKKCNFVPDLIHSVYWNSGQVAKELSNKLKIPYVHTVISNGLRRKTVGMKETLEQRYKIEKEIFQFATYIFCITPSERIDLVNLYQIDAKKIIIPGRPVSSDFLYPAHDDFGIPYRYMVNSSDISTTSNIKLDCTINNINNTNDWWSKRAFLYCGRIGSNKGVDIIIKAWYKLKTIFCDLCPALWIVGGNLSEIENLKVNFNSQYDLQKHEARGDLIWWGYLDQRGISTLMLKSHALIMHSSYEPGGRVIIEALSGGIPVICTPYGFGADYIFNWYNGFQVPYGKIDVLYHTLALFIKQPYLSNMLGINAKTFAKKIIKEWDFFGSHQTVYNAAIAGIKKNFQYTGLIEPIEYRKKYMNTYPYFNNIIADQELKLLLEEKILKENLQLYPLLSEECALWVAKVDSGEYEIRQPYTRLLDSVYYNPFDDNLVDKRTYLYEREKHISDLKIVPIIGSIDSHYIYIKEKFATLKWNDVENNPLQNALVNLLNRIYTNNVSEILPKIERFNIDWRYNSADKIMDTYKSYYKEIPVYLYHSHNINLDLSVRQLYFILTDLHNVYSEDIMDMYNKSKDILHNIAQITSPYYGECLEDCSLDNIVFNSKSLECFFKKATTLYWGDTTRMVADFLHNYLIYLLSSNVDLFNLDKYINCFVIYERKDLCMGWLFVIVFEKLAFYLNTLQEEQFKKEFCLLKKLIAFYIDNEKTS